jgi:hypothetical protein
MIMSKGIEWVLVVRKKIIGGCMSVRNAMGGERREEIDIL